MLRYLEDAAPAAAQVATLLTGTRPLMSWINLGEVHYVIRRARGEHEAARTLRDLRRVLDVRLPDAAHILDAARIKADHPMSFADAFAAALAVRSDAELWTGDPELLIADASWRWRDLR
ncbi:MAG: PIN domain-containing protein [Actinobacteria bacterium]|nr:PIN domain-containing protein [Actinomycetota bacterium]